MVNGVETFLFSSFILISVKLFTQESLEYQNINKLYFGIYKTNASSIEGILERLISLLQTS